MTFDRQPKLACWELWHLWRDFEVTPIGSGQFQIHWKREYAARKCRLMLQVGAQECVYPLKDFAPHSTPSIDVPPEVAAFRWRMDYTTHGGLPMKACGAYPLAVEEADFLDLLRERDTNPFLKELFDAQVTTIDGESAPPTLREIERDDGVVSVAFRKRNGDVYVTAFTRTKPESGLYDDEVTLDIGSPGRVTAVDEFTGQAIASSISVQQTATGVRISNLRVFLLAGSAAAGENLVENPSFEQSASNRKAPATWGLPKMPGTKFTWDDQVSHSGNRSGRVEGSPIWVDPSI